MLQHSESMPIHNPIVLNPPDYNNEILSKHNILILQKQGGSLWIPVGVGKISNLEVM